jgi:fumarate hydratase class II
MHIAAYTMATERTIPALRGLRDAIALNAEKWSGIVKIGRTHLQDATPLTVGQEWSGYAGALDDAIAEVEHVTHGLLPLAMGGTAVGTGLNAPEDFGAEVAAEIAAMTGVPYQTAGNKFTAQATLDRMVRAHGGLKAAAVTLFKIANDLRWLGSGPRTGLGELILPSNEPGSSIMPGKVNPAQAEAMLMVAIQVIASDVAVTMGGAEGNLELNAFRPILIDNYLHSALIMADMCDHLREFMIEGTQLNEARLTENIERSVMIVTALSPVIGYDQASVIAHYAVDHGLTLKQAALANGVSEELFDRVVDPVALTHGGPADRPAGASGEDGKSSKEYHLQWRFRTPLGPQAELQAHRLCGVSPRLVFPARTERTSGHEEGLPCPAPQTPAKPARQRVRCPGGRVCGT